MARFSCPTLSSFPVSGVSVPQVVSAIHDSPEFHTQQITSYYHDYLRRDPDPAGLRAWVQAMLGGMPEEPVVVDFLTSFEFVSAHPGTAGFVTELYDVLLQRTPDAAELTAWTAAAESGVPRAAVVAGFLASPELATVWIRGPAQQRPVEEIHTVAFTWRPH